ncbi:MAG: ATP-binding protein [Proteobacteria bacterium]|nr:ATP-binding protein [Pseudomonadota bacterium]
MKYCLRVFVTGKNPHHRRVLDNLHHLCDAHLGADYELEVVDVIERPAVAEEHRVLTTPALLKLSPPPQRRIIGDLSGGDEFLLALGLSPAPSTANPGWQQKPTSVDPWQLLTLSPDGVVLVDAAGIVVFVNPAAGELLNRPTDSLLGQEFGLPVVGGKIMEVELPQHRLAEMRTIDTEWQGQAAHLATLRDITQRKKDEKALHLLNQKLRDASMAKSRFVSNTSHELRTPLNAINNYAQLLDEGVYGPLTESQHRAVEGILECCGYQRRLIGDILDLAKVEAGYIEIAYATVNVSEICRDVMNTCRGLMTSTNVELTSEVADGLPDIRTDPTRLRQILICLLDNAIKFTSRGRICLRAQSTTNRVVASVSDTGIGIAPENLQEIFHPFIKVDNEVTSRFPGAGLGLSISQRLTELLGGTIAVCSQQGEGTTFTVSLPRSPVASR